MDPEATAPDLEEPERSSTQSREPPLRSTNATAERHKRLLGLARNRLEETTKQLQERERQLQALQAKLQEKDEELRVALSSDAVLGSAGQLEVVDVLARVEVDGSIHLLSEYSGIAEPQWRSFKDEDRANDFIRRDSGEPVKMPAPYMSPAEVAERVDSLEQELSNVKEEFRRYRVRMQISAKQHERNVLETNQVRSTASAAQAQRLDRDVLRARDQEWQVRVKSAEDARQAAQREGDSWKKLYEQEKKLREDLMRRGVETALAASWRKRYEHALREKDRIVSLLRLFHASGTIDVEEAEEAEILEDAELLEADVDAELERSSNRELRERIKELQTHFSEYQKQAEELLHKEKHSHVPSSPIMSHTPQNGRQMLSAATNGAAKLAYIKNLLTQYWATQDTRVRRQTEETLATVLDFSSGQKAKLREVQASRDNWFANAFQG